MLEGTDKKILDYLAENGQSSTYDLSNRGKNPGTGLNNQTVRQSLKRMKNQSLVSEEEKEAEKSPHPKKVYKMTGLGILAYIGECVVDTEESSLIIYSPEAWTIPSEVNWNDFEGYSEPEFSYGEEMFESLAKNYGDFLPTILGKYRFLKERNLGETIPWVLKLIYENDFDLVKGMEPHKQGKMVSVLFFYRLVRALTQSLPSRGSDHPFMIELNPIFRKHDKDWEEIFDQLTEDDDIRHLLKQEIERQRSIDRGFDYMLKYLREKPNRDINQDKSKGNGDEKRE